jgi:hypothetical protein
MFESTPVYPSPARYWETVAKHKVTQFYSAPTAVRLLRRCVFPLIFASLRFGLDFIRGSAPSFSFFRGAARRSCAVFGRDVFYGARDWLVHSGCQCAADILFH